jgi:hypothetical protein
MGLLVLIKPGVILPAEVVLQRGVGKDLLRSEGGRRSTGGNEVDRDGGQQDIAGDNTPEATLLEAGSHGRVEGKPVVAIKRLNLE